MKYGELNLGQVEAIVNKLGGMEGVQRFLSGELVLKAPDHPVYGVTVDYGLTLAQMIELGKYDWTNNNITVDHFLVKGEGKREVQVVLFHFNKVMAFDNVVATMKQEGFGPARIEHLLALGAKQPELQRQFPIVALGSVWRSSAVDRRVAYLGWGGAERGLGLYWCECDWGGCCRFVAVRQVS